jgi:hypothetical protein
MTETTTLPVVTVNTPVYEIARIIRKDWAKVYFGAVPYLEAMSSLTTVKDAYGYDSGKSIVNYFLANASTWRGETAKAVKLVLNKMVK